MILIFQPAEASASRLAAGIELSMRSIRSRLVPV